MANWVGRVSDWLSYVCPSCKAKLLNGKTAKLGANLGKGGGREGEGEGMVRNVGVTFILGSKF